MPHKNPRCSECGYKMKHNKWIEFVKYAQQIIGNTFFNYGEQWKRVVKCPRCGAEKIDFKTRKLGTREKGKQ